MLDRHNKTLNARSAQAQHHNKINYNVGIVDISAACSLLDIVRSCVHLRDIAVQKVIKINGYIVCLGLISYSFLFRFGVMSRKCSHMRTEYIIRHIIMHKN